MVDAGTTYSTAQVLQNFTEGNNPEVVFLVGDHTCESWKPALVIAPEACTT